MILDQLNIVAGDDSRNDIRWKNKYLQSTLNLDQLGELKSESKRQAGLVLATYICYIANLNPRGANLCLQQYLLVAWSLVLFGAGAVLLVRENLCMPNCNCIQEKLGLIYFTKSFVKDYSAYRKINAI